MVTRRQYKKFVHRVRGLISFFLKKEARFTTTKKRREIYIFRKEARESKKERDEKRKNTGIEK